MATIFFQRTLSGWIAEIHDVVVDKNHRGKGVGEQLMRKLLETAEEFAKEHKQDIKVSTLPAVPNALRPTDCIKS